MTEPREERAAATPKGERRGRTPRPTDDQLWDWVDQLERYAEAGLHARGFAHEVSNVITAVLGNCELALLAESAEQMREDVEEIARMARRARARLLDFRNFLNPVGEPQPPIAYGVAIDAAERYLAHRLRRVQPRMGEGPALEKRTGDDAPIALPPPRLVHALVTAIERFIDRGRAFLGPLVVTSKRDGQHLIVDFALEAGCEPGQPGDQQRQMGRDVALTVARRNLEGAGGGLEEGDDGSLRLIFRIASRDEDSRRLRDQAPSPWSFHR